jgi:hypothetical protein
MSIRIGERISVGTSFSNGVFWLAVVVGMGVAGLGAAMLGSEPVLAWVFFSLGGVILLVTILVGARAHAGRKWLTVKESGLLIEDREGAHEFADAQIHGLSYSPEVQFRNGEAYGVKHRLVLWADEGGHEKMFDLAHDCLLVVASPVQGLAERLHGALLALARKTLEESGSWGGPGWRVERDHLELPRPGQPQSYRWEEFSAVEVFDNQVCFWMKGETEPRFRFPLAARDSRLLLDLVRERLPKPKEGQSPDPEGLGRVLFERRRGNWWMVLVVGLLVMAGGTGLLLDAELIVGSIIVTIGVGLVAYAFNLRSSYFRCHQRGVCMTGWVENREIRFEEVDVFTYSATRHFVNGAYSGTAFVFKFVPRPETAKKSISFSMTLQSSDQEMELLRDHIARVVAARMLREVAAGSPVMWTAFLRFLPEALEHTPSGFLGRKAPVQIPYSSISGFNMNQGVFFIFVKGQDRAVIQVQCAEPNFFPGYLLLTSLFKSPEQSAPAPQAQEAPNPGAPQS